MKTLLTYVFVLLAMVTGWLGVTAPASMPSISQEITGQ